MQFIIKSTVVVSAATHGDAVKKLQQLLEDANRSVTGVYVATIDKVEEKK